MSQSGTIPSPIESPNRQGLCLGAANNAPGRASDPLSTGPEVPHHAFTAAFPALAGSHDPLPPILLKRCNGYLGITKSEVNKLRQIVVSALGIGLVGSAAGDNGFTAEHMWINSNLKNKQ